MGAISFVIIFVLFISLVAFIGQFISAVRPKLAAKLGFMESESEVDPLFFAYERAIALADILVSWTLPVACILFLFNNANWVYFGIIGGTIFFYYFGLIAFSRWIMYNKKMRIGTKADIRNAYILAIICGLSGLFMIIFSIISAGGI